MSSAMAADAVFNATNVDSVLIPEVQDTLARISSHKRVLGVMILHNSTTELKIVHSTWPEAECTRHAQIVANITKQAQLLFPVEGATEEETSGLSVQPSVDENISSANDDGKQKDTLSFVTIRSQQREILVAPDHGYLLVVLQNPHVKSES